LLIFCDEGENVSEYFPISRFWSDERGATAIEYGLICAMIGVFLLGISATGGSLSGLYDKLTKIVEGLAGGSNNSG
jgi:pilus assembly protein Flp/PilA